MTIGRYCQLCGAAKKPREIIGEVNGVVLNADCLVSKVFAVSPEAVRELHSQIRFCGRCGTEQPLPLPTHCVQCKAVLTPQAAAKSLEQVGKLAPLNQRLLAFLLDLLPIALLSYGGALLLSLLLNNFKVAELEKVTPTQIYLMSFLFSFLLYHTLLTALLGRSLGKMLLGLRVVLKEGTTKIGWARSFLRSALYFLTLYVLPLGAILVRIYELREKWAEIIERDGLFHNSLTDTVVIRKT